MGYVTVSADIPADEVLADVSTENLERELAERNNTSPMKALTDELYIAMSTGNHERQDSICRTLVWELGGRIV